MFGGINSAAHQNEVRRSSSNNNNFNFNEIDNNNNNNPLNQNNAKLGEKNIISHIFKKEKQNFEKENLLRKTVLQPSSENEDENLFYIQLEE